MFLSIVKKTTFDIFLTYADNRKYQSQMMWTSFSDSASTTGSLIRGYFFFFFLDEGEGEGEGGQQLEHILGWFHVTVAPAEEIQTAKKNIKRIINLTNFNYCSYNYSCGYSSFKEVEIRRRCNWIFVEYSGLDKLHAQSQSGDRTRKFCWHPHFVVKRK